MKKLILIILILFLTQMVRADNIRSGGLSLLEPSGARAFSLGEAFSSIDNDVSAFGYNPGTLGTLKGGEVNLSYQNGVDDDSFAKGMFGIKTENGGMGFSFSYFNGGEVNALGPNGPETVIAQRDMIFGLGYARGIEGLSVGMALKFISSELLEQENAHAVSGDIGIHAKLRRNLNFGISLQNYGTDLKYRNEADELPRFFRSGLSYRPSLLPFNGLIAADANYFVNEQSWRPALGIEFAFGALAVRGGYKTILGAEELSMGAGFVFKGSSLDYSIGLLNNFDAQHRASYSYRFGLSHTNTDVVRTVIEIDSEHLTKQKPLEDQPNQVARAEEQWNSNQHLYAIRPDDTLQSISKRVYGSERYWKQIWNDNFSSIQNPKKLPVGHVLILP